MEETEGGEREHEHASSFRFYLKDHDGALERILEIQCVFFFENHRQD